MSEVQGKGKSRNLKELLEGVGRVNEIPLHFIARWLSPGRRFTLALLSLHLPGAFLL